MSKVASLSMLLVLVLVAIGSLAIAQAPTGIITGTVTDETGAVIPNATLTITDKATGSARTLTTSASGLFTAPALPVGDYEVRAEAQGFRTIVRDATVQTGGTTTVNMPMSVGEARQVVTVEAASAQINYETHNVQGVIQRETIQELPLNGRSYMQLAALEPGVTIASGTPAQFNTLFTVSVLGAGNRTVFTIDGGNVSDNIDTGGGISSMNFSQDVIQEFQISSVNFDLATPIAAGGAVNIVTRSGSNAFHGSGYFFFRDHNMAAYPNLRRDARTPDPFFVRRNPGVWVGGPIMKDKLFFFGNFEYQNQIQALNIATTSPSFQPLTGTYGSPYHSKLTTVKLDYRINEKNSMFVRYSHDGNDGFGQSLEFGDPSNWPHNINWADQGIIGLTTVLTPAIVNDVRIQYNYWNNHNNQSVASDCSAPCVAGSLPNVFFFQGSNFPAVGPNFNAPQARNTRRYELVEALSWQKGAHRFKFGGDLNPTYSAGLWGFCTPLCTAAFSPEFVRGVVPPAFVSLLFPTLPTVLHTDADVLNLPVLSLNSSIFSGVGVGSVPLPGAYKYDDNKGYNQYRAYFQDTWKITKNFTLNYGLAWNAQKGFYNVGIPKPQYLAPILGANNLGVTANNLREFQPAFGFAWSPFKDNKTVIRGGGGIYWDSTPGYYKLREAASIAPPGSARNTLSASAFTNIYPGIFNLGTGQPIPVGASLPLSALTNMTVGLFDALVAAELPAIESKISPTNPQRSGPITVTGIDLSKQGVEIYPEHNPLARSYQTSIGIQHEMGHGVVVQADYARRQGLNVSLGEVDDNLYARFLPNAAGLPTRTPVIPTCAPSQVFVAGPECSSGAITVWTDQGRALYQGLLVKVNKRFSNHFQGQLSYAFQKATTTTVWDDSNWFAGVGEYLPHNNLNVSGVVQLAWGFELSVNSSFISRTPQNAFVNGLSLPGTVPAGSTEPLPGIEYGSLNAGTSKQDLAKAVGIFNAKYAGTKNSNGSTIPQLVLPPDYQFGDPTFSQDFRLTKNFRLKERVTFSVLAEMFNSFNISNLSYGTSATAGFTLDTRNPNPAKQTYVFGQPTQRATQTFGSGGPRAVQLGARITF